VGRVPSLSELACEALKGGAVGCLYGQLLLGIFSAPGNAGIERSSNPVQLEGDTADRGAGGRLTSKPCDWGDCRVISPSAQIAKRSPGATALECDDEWSAGVRNGSSDDDDRATSWRTARLLVVDSQPIVSAGVFHVAAGTSWLEPVGHARTGGEAIAMAGAIRPDIVLLELRLSDMLAPELIQALRSHRPELRLVVFTAYPPSSALYAAVEDEVDGVVRKDADFSRLVEVLHRVHCEQPVRRNRDSVLTRDTRMHGLTRREYEILRRVAMGETNMEIARAVGLTSNTVKTYFQRTLEKLGARNRVEALLHASEIGLL